MQHRWSFVLVTVLTGICLLAGPVQGAEARRVTKSVTPTYPSLARQMKVEGAVKVEAVVGSDGNVNKVIGRSYRPPLQYNALCLNRFLFGVCKLAQNFRHIQNEGHAAAPQYGGSAHSMQALK